MIKTRNTIIFVGGVALIALVAIAALNVQQKKPAAIPDFSRQSIAGYFGNEARGDFNGDGIDDVAFLITKEPGGSGTFFYVTAMLSTPSGYVRSNDVFLGDRIAPQVTEFRNGTIIVNYAERKPDEPFTAQPSVGVSRYFAMTDGVLQEVK